MPKRSQKFITDLKNVSRFSSKPVKAAIALLISGFLGGVAFEEFIGIGTWHSYALSTEKVNVCFTPPSGCGALIIQQISQARESIYVQAFNFYSEPIANALVKAKNRGVNIRIILDKTNNDNHKSQAKKAINAGIEVTIDTTEGIAHNKVMIIDSKKVITGSFNFSDSADTRNAENVLLIDDPDMAEAYLNNWMARRTVAKSIRNNKNN